MLGMGEEGWWKGELEGKEGVFPDNFVELIPLYEPSCMCDGYGVVGVVGCVTLLVAVA